MDGLFFLPAWPPTFDRLLLIGLALLAAILAGEASARLVRLPRLLGWIVAGALLGPSVLGVIDSQTPGELGWLMEAALGLVLFEFGNRVDLRWLRRNAWLGVASVLEAGLAFGAVAAWLLYLDMPPLICALAGAAAMATSPAIVLSLSREARARGQVTDRIAFLTALDCVYAFIAVGMLFALLHADYGHGWLSTVAHPLYLVFVSLGLALLLAGVALLVLKRLHGHPDAQRVSALAFVLIGVALADWMNLPPVLVTLVFGMRLASLVRDRQIGALDFGPLGYVLVVLLFVLQAASLDLSLFIGGLLAGLGVVVARQAGKIVGVLLTARMSGLSGRRGLLVGLGLGPMSVVTLMLVQETVREFPERGAVLAGFMVSALVVQEIVGTLLARFAIARAGETDQAVR